MKDFSRFLVLFQNRFFEVKRRVKRRGDCPVAFLLYDSLEGFGCLGEEGIKKPAFGGTDVNK